MRNLSSERQRSYAFLVVLVLSTGCVGGAKRGTPLYPVQGQPVPLQSVAQLVGDIAAVDGKSVSGQGRNFELLPGCHVVSTPTSWGERESTATFSGNMPKRTFVINMQANRSYIIEYELNNRTGNGGTLLLNAREQDAAGAPIATLDPTSNEAEIERCGARRANGAYER